MYWYDGKLCDSTTVQLDVTEPGLLYGATVFTTLRVYQQSIEHPRSIWLRHLRRLQEAVTAFDWPSPDWERLREEAQQLAAHHPVLRVTLFPDGRELITGRSIPAELTQRQQHGIAAWVADEPQFRRAIPGNKTGNYLPAWLALQQANKRNAQEAILTDAEGCWLESSTGNLWGWCEGQWWTPPLDVGILPGLVREEILDRAIDRNINIVQRSWPSSIVSKFKALAYTNCVVEIVPIRTVIRSSDDTSLSFDPTHPSLDVLRSLLEGDL
ncbi:MAG: aminotransferase class IV [Cyanobacteria bacterium SBC]|nr:aminotransferase class IV [Cyanobacteria bacterium SBC]